jgi:hypothetical protein
MTFSLLLILMGQYATQFERADGFTLSERSNCKQERADVADR